MAAADVDVLESGVVLVGEGFFVRDGLLSGVGLLVGLVGSRGSLAGSGGGGIPPGGVGIVGKPGGLSPNIPGIDLTLASYLIKKRC